MTSQDIAACEKLRRMGYAKGCRARMYGEEFELTSDPIIARAQSESVYVEAIERRTGKARRVSIPLPIVRMIFQERVAA